MDVGGAELGHLYYVCFQLHQAQNNNRLAQPRGFFRLCVALFTEMYGFPLTIYLLSGWLQTNYPQLDLLTHENGHLLHVLLGLEGNPHFNILHILSTVLIFIGFLLLSSSWCVLHQAQQNGVLATSGWYAHMRHPQYSAFILIMIGFLLQWPTLPTLVMFPILLIVYKRLALREERVVEQEFGETYQRYRDATPALIPKFKSSHSKEASISTAKEKQP